jgi:DNA replication and repair protein RecF
LDPQLVEYGLKLVEKREEETRFFSHIFSPIYEEVAAIKHIEVVYRPSWKERTPDGIIQELFNSRERDVFSGATNTGPHRDRYSFTKDKKEFVATGSTGQRRLLALLLRIAQTCRYTEMTGALPTLLFDDVLLELDGEKRHKFLNTLPQYEQAFFTFLPEEPFQRYRKDDTLVYDVFEGKLTGRT